MVRKTKVEALETRAQVLDAAEQVFSEKGVTNTSLLEIATAAGVTRGAIYWHFKNKYELIEALLQRAKLPLDEMLDARSADFPGDPLGQIRVKSIAVLQSCVADTHLRAVCTILFHKCEHIAEAQPVLQRRLESRDECAREIQDTFRAAIVAGQVPKELDPHLATFGLFSYIDGLIYNWLLDPGQFPLAEAAPHLVDTYLCGLRSPVRP